MYSLNCNVCGKPLTSLQRMDGECQGDQEQTKHPHCGLNNPWYDYWDRVIFNEMRKLARANTSSV